MGQTFAEKSAAMFRQTIFIITAVGGAVGFLFFKIYQKVYLYASILIHQIKTACGCTQMAQLAAMHPLIFGALAVLAAISLAFLFYAAYKLVKLIRQTRKFTAQYLGRAKFGHSAKLSRAIWDLRLDKSRIIEIQEARSVVFCFGLWRPKVCMASGLAKILRKDELEAVLLHEYQHMVSREPAKLFIIKYWQSVFGWLPGIKTCVKKYITFSELAADERATANFTDRAKLARALLKITQIEDRRLARPGLALSFFTSVIAERVNKLADNAYVPQFRLGGKRFVLGLGSALFGLLILFVFLSDSGQALAMHDGGSCLTPAPSQPSTLLICAAGNQSQPAVAECNRH